VATLRWRGRSTPADASLARTLLLISNLSASARTKRPQGLGILKTRARLTTRFPGSSRRRAAGTPFFETRTVCQRGVLAATVRAADARTCPPFRSATPLSAVAACRSTPLVLPVFIGTLLASDFADSIAFLGRCAVLSVYLCFCPCPCLSVSFCLVSCALFLCLRRVYAFVCYCVLCLVSGVWCLVSGSVFESFL